MLDKRTDYEVRDVWKNITKQFASCWTKKLMLRLGFYGKTVTKHQTIRFMLDKEIDVEIRVVWKKPSQNNLLHVGLRN